MSVASPRFTLHSGRSKQRNLGYVSHADIGGRYAVPVLDSSGVHVEAAIDWLLGA